MGTGGVYCTMFREEIIWETVAEECAEYDPVPWANGGSRGGTKD